MKQKLITTILIWLVTQTMSLGQCQEDETISTNPNNPINTELPSSRLQYKNQFNWAKTTNNSVAVIPINSAANWDRNFIPLGSTFIMESPFSNAMDKEYKYLFKSNGGINPAELDWHWQDGWELMWLNLGWYPDNSTTISRNPAHRTSPYYVLYNRYTGKLRFFGNHFQQMGISNTAQNIDLNIHMSSDNKSGIFRHVGNYDQALDQKTKYEDLFSNNKHPNDNARFYSTDFQLGYDPCVCHYESSLEFHVQENADWNVNLSGRSITMNGSINDYPPDFLTNRTWHDDSLRADFGGSLIYKNFSDLNDKYEKELTEYEKKLATYNKPQNLVYREIINLSKDLVKNGVPTAAMPNVGPGIRSMVKTFMKNYPGSYDEDNPKELAKGIIKTADGVLGRGFDYLVKQYINPDIVSKPVKPTMPTASFSEMVIGGSISHSKDYKLFGTAAPGSFNVASNTFEVFNYPIYNKPTGLYALLKTPKIAFGNHIRSNEKTTFHGATSWSIWYPQSRRGNTLIEERIGLSDLVGKHRVFQDISFKLDEKLVYKLNRNLDINDDNSNILVSFQVELEGNLPNKFHNANTQLGEKRLELDLGFTNYKIISHEPATSSSKERIVLEIPWQKMEDIAKYFYGGVVSLTSYYKVGVREQIQRRETTVNSSGNIVSQNITVHRDRYKNLSRTLIDTVCVRGSYIGMNNNLNFCYKRSSVDNEINISEVYKINPSSKYNEVPCKIKSIKMKVLTDLTFDQLSSKGGEINTTQVFTYLLYDNSSNNGPSFSESDFRIMNASETKNLSNSIVYPPLVVLSGQMITPSSQHVTYVNGNEIWIRAEEIQVHGPLNVQPGHKLILNVVEGGGGVRFNPGVTASPDVLIRWFKEDDKFKLFPDRTTFEATNDQVTSFCSNNISEYKANQSSASMIPKDTEETENEAEVMPEKPTEIINSEQNPSRLFPNPNNGNFTIQFEQNLQQDAKIQISDISGRVLYNTTLSKGNQNFQINAPNLANGIYLVAIIQKQNKSTHKITLYHP